jgi:hypothetical protein
MFALLAAAKDPKSSSSSVAPAPTMLIGCCQRPDGVTILQFSDLIFNGRLKADYFNPHPIHVALDGWKHQDGFIGVFVGLRTHNYPVTHISPGSTYMLAYDAKRDRLIGIYYQAALQQEFQVEFERMP